MVNRTAHAYLRDGSDVALGDSADLSATVTPDGHLHMTGKDGETLLIAAAGFWDYVVTTAVPEPEHAPLAVGDRVIVAKGSTYTFRGADHLNEETRHGALTGTVVNPSDEDGDYKVEIAGYVDVYAPARFLTRIS